MGTATATVVVRAVELNAYCKLVVGTSEGTAKKSEKAKKATHEKKR